ncbi:hypothetical protein SDC9_177129 [bioreactor metagenome]|uniref:Uncharacterized protein n=1 Tax=bioreactor metagenome TaxID=1076179 RepID=A0A645GTV7_9ZZZZ
MSMCQGLLWGLGPMLGVGLVSLSVAMAWRAMVSGLGVWGLGLVGCGVGWHRSVLAPQCGPGLDTAGGFGVVVWRGFGGVGRGGVGRLGFF